MGIYGAKVQGEEKAAAALEATTVKAKFGSKVLGSKVDQRTEEEAEAAFEAKQAEKELEVPQGTPDEELQALLDQHAGDDGYLSIGDLKAVLKEMPHALDRMIAWERQRSDGMRIGALQEFLRLESARDGGPRAHVQGFLESSLAKVRAAGS